MPKPASLPAEKETIWLVDRRDYWRHQFQQVLRRQGYSVLSFGDYPEVAAHEAEASKPPDLIVLACGAIGDEEIRMTEQASQLQHDVLVLAASLPLPAVRALFLSGARDVAELPGSGERLLDLVRRTLTRSREMMSYRAPVAAPTK